MTFDERWNYVIDTVLKHYGTVSRAFDYIKDQEVYREIMNHGGYIWCCRHGKVSSTENMCVNCYNEFQENGWQ